MKLLLDSNIVIDFLGKREPYYQSARFLFVLGQVGEFELWVSAAQTNDIFYVLSDRGKRSQIESMKRCLKEVRKVLRICSVGQVEIDEALDSPWEDVEDACVYQSARKIRADAIVTRNLKDYVRSSIKVFDYDSLFTYLKEEKNLTYELIPFY